MERKLKLVIDETFEGVDYHPDDQPELECKTLFSGVFSFDERFFDETLEPSFRDELIQQIASIISFCYVEETNLPIAFCDSTNFDDVNISHVMHRLEILHEDISFDEFVEPHHPQLQVSLEFLKPTKEELKWEQKCLKKQMNQIEKKITLLNKVEVQN